MMMSLISKRPFLKKVFEETIVNYVVERSPAVNKYVKKISEITGLPEDVIKRSRPVRNYVKAFLGF